MHFEPIAIVGRGSVLPGALTPDALWAAIAEGRDLVTPAPAGYWGLDHARMLVRPGQKRLPEQAVTDRGGYVRGFADIFDPARYGVDPALVRDLDPIFHWLLHVVHSALLEAGIGPAARNGAGLFVGNLCYPTHTANDFAERVWGYGSSAATARNRFAAGFPTHLTARLLGLTGDCHALDAACASSLYAIKNACDWLHDHRADIMVAAAVNRADDLFLHVGFSELQALSPSGRSRPFHRDADGLLPAEGAACVVLKRLGDAVRDGNTIYGVIRGAGISNDGRKGGFLAPDSGRQIAALRSAYETSGIDPRDVGLIECHATGTRAGDAAEIATLAEVFKGASDVPVGSLKSNLGHLITAAGLGGLLKVLGAFSAGQRPATLHVDAPMAALADTPIRPVRTREDWKSRTPRLAAVNAFGFGGNNAHLIVEEWRAPVAKMSPAVRSFNPLPEVAICGIGLVTGAGRWLEAFDQHLFAAAGDVRPTIDEVRLPLTHVKFPPADLRAGLAQQTLMLEAALQAADMATLESGPRTGILAGMNCDPEIARYALRWRGTARGAPEAANAAAPLTAAAVIGCLPNVPANRLNAQFDATAFGYSLASEELSGIAGLKIAVRALARGEVDEVLVGAVETVGDSVHAAAAADTLLEKHVAGEGAVALVLRRRDDPRVSRYGCLALLKVDPSGGTTLAPADLRARFGHMHAADGLMQVAAAICAVRRGAPDMRVEVSSFSGIRDTVQICAAEKARHVPANALRTEEMLILPARMAPVRRPRTKQGDNVVFLPPAPVLPACADEPTVLEAPAAVAAGESPTLRIYHHALTSHRAYIAQQTDTYRQYLRLIASRGSGERTIPQTTEPPDAVHFSRAQLESLASGKISSVLGAVFAQQDGYRRQVRLPEPPLLLADRVVSLAGEPGKLGRGRIVTETDVSADAWYLDRGHMPPGIVIESGQADLLLISWQGIDFFNKGERVYRLLGCELTFHGGLPRPGDTLRFDIEITGHAKTGDVRLFFFQYDCHISGRLALSVRNGQAGFFTDAELADSGGVLWDAADDTPDLACRVDVPPCASERRWFGRELLDLYLAGDAFACFGPGFEMAAAHSSTPRPPGGRMRLIDEIAAYDPHGGPWGRGYLRATYHVAPDAWFYAGHFKDDPCMPGTLMADAAVQALAYFMAACGHTIDKDGWRFEPDADVPYKFICRGQVVPDRAHALEYEIFVEEVIGGDAPVVQAALLCRSDGFKVFQCRRFRLRLVPDFPLAERMATLDAETRSAFAAAVPHEVHAGASLRGDFAALLACAWGKPSQAFGPMLATFDGGRKLPRLPGPPYHFMSRVASVDCPPGTPQVGGSVEAEYRVPADAWYFQDNGAAVMPFSVLMEVLLQPCGWLAQYMGFTLGEMPLAFRNLDGDSAVLHRTATRNCGVIRTRARLTHFASAGSVTVVFFEVESRIGDTLLMEMNTSFGFFPADALVRQSGLPATAEDRTRIERVGSVDMAVDAIPGIAPLARGQLRMVDAITDFVPDGGAAGLGVIRGLQRVEPQAWYFKAHFYSDPVQPGSLGLEALLQLLQCFMRLKHLDARFAAPRFDPIACGRPLTWKYRGQVLPKNLRVVTELEITNVETSDTDTVVTARGSLWVDGMRIYQVDGLSMRVNGEAPQVPAAAGRRDRTLPLHLFPALGSPPVMDIARVRARWREVTGDRGGPVEDLYIALFRRFANRIVLEDPDGFEDIRKGPVLFLGNHQTGVESSLFTLGTGVLCDLPITALAKREHQETWMGTLVAHCERYPGLAVPQPMLFFDRVNPAEMLLLLKRLEGVIREGRSILVHAEGTRALGAGLAVRRMSSVFLDFVKKLGLPIVPVRFYGGLPEEVAPDAVRQDYPVGYGTQDYYVGRAIIPAALTGTLLAQRNTVISALNATGPALQMEKPNPPNPAFAARVEWLHHERGIHRPIAAFVIALDEDPEVHGALREMVQAVISGAPVPDGDAAQRWIKELAELMRAVYTVD